MKRWVMDAGYMVVEDASGRTAGTKPSFRFPLFYTGLVNANLWIIARFIHGKTRTETTRSRWVSFCWWHAV